MKRRAGAATAHKNSATPLKAQQAYPRPEAATVFIEWARSHLAELSTVRAGSSFDDLAPLGEQIGDASLVALSEGVHGGAEPLEFRNRLIQYLVLEKGFTAIALESGIVESRAVHDYVRGGRGDLNAVLERGISWTFDQLPQNRALVQWLRKYNSDPRRERKVNFYGFDVPGSPANAEANRGIDTALAEAIEYLSGVDAAAAAAFRDRLAPLMDSMRFGLQRAVEAPGYEQLTQAQRDALTGVIADLVALLETRESRYATTGAAVDYAWALRAAIGARQVDAWLRHVPLGWQPLSASVEPAADHVDFLAGASDARDRAQADNLDWIVQQEGPQGRVLVFASRYHLSTAPVKTAFYSRETEHEVAGVYLRRRFGKRMVTIGNLIGQTRLQRRSLQRAPPDSLDGLAREIGVPLFLLDLRTAPAFLELWLRQEHALIEGEHRLKVRLASAFDILFYIDTVTTARR